MRRIFLTSDHHFGHTNVIKFCGRPFESMEEQNEQLVANWNAVVSPEDLVYHLGDITLWCGDSVAPILDALNGEIVLIRGNHDRGSVAQLPRFSSVHKELYVTIDDRPFMLRHKPYSREEVEEMRAFHPDIIMTHGHTHGEFGRFHDDQVDVSVELWDYRPIEVKNLICLYDANRAS